jgi:radical SAM superfamily enzyme YgiQ (UPF0313 family)
VKTTFVRPNFSNVRSTDAMEPLVFAILAAKTPTDVALRLIDERLEAIDYDEPTDLVALTVETYNARHSYEIAAQYRKRGVPVVMGGYHPTFLPEEALQFADAVVIGDADAVWACVVHDARSKTLQKVYRTDVTPSLAGLEFNRGIFRGKRYAPIPLVQYGRGCRYACEFCSIRAFYGSDLRQRPVHEVIAEIEQLNHRHIFLVDDNIFVDVAKAEELFRALVPLKIRWSCQISIDVATNDSLMRLLEKSGCTTAVVGFESLDSANLRQMRKAWNLRSQSYDAAVRRFHEHGIMIYGSFVFGYDQDTTDSFDRCVEFALRSKFYLANFNPLTPMPGAALYHRLEKEGRLIHDRWWLAPDYRYGDATFRPRGMTTDELSEGCFRARREFNRYSSMFRRAFHFGTNCRDPYRFGLFTASNLISRREIYRKQGRPLGDGGLLEPGTVATSPA